MARAETACAPPLERRALVLAPAGADGWFGGVPLALLDPAETRDGVAPAEAFECLRDAFDSSAPVLTAAVIGYDTGAVVHTYVGDQVEAWLAASGTGHPAPPSMLAPPSMRAPATRAPSPASLRGRAERVGPGIAPLLRDAVAEMDSSAYRDAVEEARQAIAAGEVYVLNLTYRVRGEVTGTPGAVFDGLRSAQPAPMAALFAHPIASLVSVSPERFLSASREPDGSVVVVTEPIKGTAPRHDDPARDARAAAGLAASAKERAEHVMIVDMERNDLSRVCAAGSVAVDPLFDVFPTPYCHQMRSRVTGRLAPGRTVADLLGATFPTGSVTGAPKHAALRAIGALERSPRGFYTGALVVAMPGRVDSSVLIRTLELREGAGTWGTGCGITIDSDPEAEWRESLLKCSPVLGGRAQSPLLGG